MHQHVNLQELLIENINIFNEHLSSLHSWINNQQSPVNSRLNTDFFPVVISLNLVVVSLITWKIFILKKETPPNNILSQIDATLEQSKPPVITPFSTNVPSDFSWQQFWNKLWLYCIGIKKFIQDSAFFGMTMGWWMITLRATYETALSSYLFLRNFFLLPYIFNGRKWNLIFHFRLRLLANLNDLVNIHCFRNNFLRGNRRGFEINFFAWIEFLRRF